MKSISDSKLKFAIFFLLSSLCFSLSVRAQFLSMDDLLAYYDFEETGTVGISNKAPGFAGQHDGAYLGDVSLIAGAGAGFSGDAAYAGAVATNTTDRSTLLVGNALNVAKANTSATAGKGQFQVMSLTSRGTGVDGGGSLGTEFTVSSWFFAARDADNTSTTGDIIRNTVFESVLAGASTANVYDISWATGTGASLSTYTPYLDTNAGTASTLANNQWHHVLHTVTSDGTTSTLRSYVNGELSATITAATNTVDFRGINFGAHRAGGRIFDGLLDEVNVWARPMDASEAFAIYNLGHSGQALTTSIATHVKADNTTSLSAGGAWDTGNVPGAADYLVFDGGFTQAGALNTGAAMEVAGLRVGGGSGLVEIDNSSGTLTLGNLGIDMATATRDLRIADLAAGADQNWNIAAGRTLTLGSLSGAAEVERLGDGLLIVEGPNAHEGTLRLRNGFATLASPAAIPAEGTIAVGSGAAVTLRVGDGLFDSGDFEDLWANNLAGVDIGPGAGAGIDSAGVETLGSDLAGTRGLAFSGGGTLVLTGNNTYTGGSTVAGGNLQIGNGGATGTPGTGTVALNSGAVLVIDRSGNLTISGVIAGDGSIVQQGPGTTTLGAIATYSGGTTVNNGTLVVGNSGAGGLGGIRGPVVVGPGASLEYGTTRVFGYADDISVTSLVINEGHVGSNFYNYFWNTGEEFPIEMTGGRLALGGNASGAAGNHFLSPVITVNAAPEPSVIGRADGNTTATLRLRNLTSLTVDAEAGATLVIDTPIASSNANTDTAVTRSGSLTKAGEGTLVLNEVNTFTGTTTVEGGTLVLGGMDAGGVGGIRGPVVAAPGATIEYSTARTFGYADGVSVTALTINEAQVGSDFYNYFWNRDESFPLEMTGGRLDLGGDASGAAGNHFLSPVITVNAAPEPSVIGRADGNTTATLRLRNLTSLTVDAEAGATLVIEAPVVSSGAAGDASMDQSGEVIKTGEGTLVLSGNGSYGGATSILAGTLQIGDGGTTGSPGGGTILNEAALRFNRSDDFIIHNPLHGPGVVVKQGEGALTLTANAYTGDTVIESGTLVLEQVSLDTASSVHIADGATLDLAHGATDTVAGLWLGGVRQPSGFYDSANTSSIVGGGVLHVTMGPEPPDSYEQWIGGFFPGETDPAIIGPDADANGDGVANGIIFVLGGNPLGSDNSGLLPGTSLASNPGHGIPDGEYFVITYRRSQAAAATGAGTAIEFSGGVPDEWVPATDGEDGVVVRETADGFAVGVDMVRVFIPRAGLESGFARLVAVVDGVEVASGAVSVSAVIEADPEGLANGLIAYWDFTDGFHNRVVSGRDAAAWAGTPETALPAAGLPAVRGEALILDGVSSIQLPYNATRFGQSFAISGWYFRGPAYGEVMTLLGEDNDTTIRIAWDPAEPAGLATWLGRQRMNPENPVFAASGTWRHFVFSVERDAGSGLSTLRFYDNGQLHHTGSTAVAVSGHALRVGQAGRGHPPEFWNGMIDELAVWNRPLAPEEALALYQLGQSGLPVAADYADLPASHDPVAYWSFDEGLAADLGGPAFDAQPVNGAVVEPGAGRFGGGALRLVRSSQQYVHVPQSPFGSGSHTYAAWIFLDVAAVSSSERFFVLEASGGATYPVSFGIRRPDGFIRAETYSQSGGGAVSTAIPADVRGEWHHIAVTHDAPTGDFDIFLNGRHAGSLRLGADGGLLFPPTYLNIGGHRGGTGRNWNGLIDEVAVWDRVLTRAEIASLQHLRVPQAMRYGASGYDAWLDGAGMEIADDRRSPDADAAGDGIPNLLKYARGIGPFDPGPGLSPRGFIDGPGGDWLVDVVPNPHHLGLDARFEASNDLIEWHHAEVETLIEHPDAWRVRVIPGFDNP